MTVIGPRAEAVTKKQIPDDAIECWSVTSILKVLDKPGLTYWLQQQVARAAWQRRAALDQLTASEASQLLLKQDNWTRDNELTDMQLGTHVHTALEQHILHGGISGALHTEAVPFVLQFEDWLHTMQPTFEAAEATVFDPVLLYAGTLDCICTINGVKWLLDWKTTRNDRTPSGQVRDPYVDWSLQLAAYRYAPSLCAFRPYVLDQKWSPRRYYISVEDQERALPMPQVDAAGILQLTPNTWRMYPCKANHVARDAFLQARSLQHFLEVVGKSQFGSYVEGRHEHD